jgi:hypothetical protein
MILTISRWKPVNSSSPASQGGALSPRESPGTSDVGLSADIGFALTVGLAFHIIYRRVAQKSFDVVIKAYDAVHGAFLEKMPFSCKIMALIHKLFAPRCGDIRFTKSDIGKGRRRRALGWLHKLKVCHDTQAHLSLHSPF